MNYFCGAVWFRSVVVVSGGTWLFFVHIRGQGGCWVVFERAERTPLVQLITAYLQKNDLEIPHIGKNFWAEAANAPLLGFSLISTLNSCCGVGLEYHISQ